MAPKVRLPCVAGHFYEGDALRLQKQVDSCIPKGLTPQTVKACLVPHAGLMYSGKVAGEVYASVQWPEVVILLGPDHHGGGAPFSLSGMSLWRTPLGDVEVDRDLARRLLKKITGLKEDNQPHQFEHSLEVQLPFLQRVSKKTKIVPIILGLATPEQYKRFGVTLAEGVEETGKEVVLVASSDMTHYETRESAKDKDDYALQAILSIDPDELIRRVHEKGISMCGFAPAVAMLSYALKKRAVRGELLRYQTSGEVSGDYRSVVGYAGVLIL